jgi:hypothetical protein
MVGYRLKGQHQGIKDLNHRPPADQANVEFTRPLYPYPTQSLGQ